MLEAEYDLLHRDLALEEHPVHIEQHQAGYQPQDQVPIVCVFPLHLTDPSTQEMLQRAKVVFNGTITHDKFCMTRTGRLHLTWWRRPLRSRPAGADASGYPCDATSRRGGIHETSMEHPPTVS
jgi:hypothetical protein